METRLLRGDRSSRLCRNHPPNISNEITEKEAHLLLNSNFCTMTKWYHLVFNFRPKIFIFFFFFENLLCKVEEGANYKDPDTCRVGIVSQEPLSTKNLRRQTGSLGFVGLDVPHSLPLAMRRPYLTTNSPRSTISSSLQHPTSRS